MSKTACIIITGGKTGGHLFPGIAVAQAMERMTENVRLLFVGTDAPFEIKTLSRYGYDHKAIFSRPLKGGSLIGKVSALSILCISILQALVIMIKNRPCFVLGVGGFSSFAVVLSAWLLRIPRAIQEQNAYPGLTNRMLARFSQTIFTSFKDTKGFSGLSKTRYVGNPVRKTEQDAAEEKTVLDAFDEKKFTLLVTGGSQGARSINDAFIEAVSLMEESAGRYNIIHQTGLQDEGRIRDAYKEMDLPATAKAFYHDMPRLQDLADLVITRAGAGTLFELSAKGKPAILVPYPYAADDHQTHNARSLEENDAALMIKDSELSGLVLKKAIESLSNDPNRLERMKSNLFSLALPDADEAIALHILNSIKGEG